jgi:PAS domain S-box-containing protein
VESSAVESSLDAARLLSIAVTVTSEQRVESVLQRTVQGLAAQPGVALTRIWLLPSIHLPSSWQQPPDALEGMEHLHLVASAGTPIDSPGEDWSFLQGHFARFPMHVGKVGQVAAERHPILIKDVVYDDSWIVRPEWATREGIRSFAGYPLVFRDTLLGVIAVFSRRPLGDQEFTWLGLFANYAAVAIANTRAFEDLQRVEEALRSSERNLSLTINTIPTFITVSRADGTVLSVNQAALDYHGVTLQDVQRGDHRTRFFHPDDVERVREVREEALKHPRPFQYELRAMGKDGKYRWFSVRHNPLLDDQGRIERWYAIAFDIEDRKRSEEALRRSEALLAEAQTLSSIGSFFWRVRPDEITWSEETYRIFQLDQGVPVTLELIASRVHPEDLPLLLEMIDRVRNEASDFEYEHRLLLPDHSVKHLHLVAHGRRDRDGQLEYIGAIQDVTESKVAEEALTRARSELAHMARVTTLSALTASIAHDVNQPIAAIVTSADAGLRWLTRDQPDLQRACEAITRIREDGTRAGQIISHLKAFYRKDVLPERAPVSANDVVREMLVLLRYEADRHSVVMRTQLPADLPLVPADRVQLQQVVMNLMLNGMEAMGERGGELTISTRSEPGTVLVSVSDTGLGIAPGQLEKIFRAFYTTKAGGTGMGLAISRAIIESHGGRLWATANPGRGASFHFTLATAAEA